jgi:hypothetical protein
MSTLENKKRKREDIIKFDEVINFVDRQHDMDNFWTVATVKILLEGVKEGDLTKLVSLLQTRENAIKQMLVLRQQQNERRVQQEEKERKDYISKLPSHNKLLKLKVPELRELLKKGKMNFQGRKAELIQRLGDLSEPDTKKLPIENSSPLLEGA